MKLIKGVAMNNTLAVYGHSLALLTDLYQLTMAYGYWKSKAHEKEAVFNLFFRNNPFQGGFSIACGLGVVTDLLNNFRFEDQDISYLSGLKGNDGKTLFSGEFLDYLHEMTFQCDIDAIPEGTVVFPHEPLLRVQGPIVQCQILETALLNIINFQTLVATKSSRICLAARGDPVLEFGLRRAQGIDGSLAASRAAYIGGCAATSNVLAGKLYGIPVRGTHAHSWIMAFDDELEAFQKYARAMPNNCVFLVDTYDTVDGVRNAVQAAKSLRKRGHELIGIRLDSGDLAYHSIEARKILNAAGFPKAAIVASNDLDEHIIASLKKQGANIGIWGVGTKLVTGHDQPALGGVYKLAAIRHHGEHWQYKVKLSEQALKVSNPGIQQVRRYSRDNRYLADVIFDTQFGLNGVCEFVDPEDPSRINNLPDQTDFQDLLVPVFREGKLIYDLPSISQTRKRVQNQLVRFGSEVRRLADPAQYPVVLDLKLHELKSKLIHQAREIS